MTLTIDTRGSSAVRFGFAIRFCVIASFAALPFTSRAFAAETKPVLDFTAQMLERVHTTKQLAELAAILFPEEDDRQFIKSTTEKIPATMTFSFVKSRDAIEIKIGAQTLKLVSPASGAVTINGHEIKLPSENLKGLAASIRKAAETKSAYFKDLRLRWLLDVAEVHAVAPLILAGVYGALYLAGAVYTGYQCRHVVAMSRAVHVAPLSDDRKFCGIAAAAWPLAFPFLTDDGLPLSAKVSCPKGQNGQMKLSMAMYGGGVRQSEMRVISGRPSRIQFVENSDPSSGVTYVLDEQGKVIEVQPTQQKPKPDIIAMEKAVLKQCYSNPGDIETFSRIVDLKNVSVKASDAST